MNIKILPELYESLSADIGLDSIDWTLATRYAENWKLSVADALLDLGFVNEVSLAQCLAKAHNLMYRAGPQLVFDFSEVGYEHFDDLMNVGAAPLENNRLAICNPYDDFHGLLDKKFCHRELVVSERSAIVDALRNYALNEWMGG